MSASNVHQFQGDYAVPYTLPRGLPPLDEELGVPDFYPAVQARPQPTSHAHPTHTHLTQTRPELINSTVHVANGYKVSQDPTILTEPQECVVSMHHPKPSRSQLSAAEASTWSLLLRLQHAKRGADALQGSGGRLQHPLQWLCPKAAPASAATFTYWLEVGKSCRFVRGCSVVSMNQSRNSVVPSHTHHFFCTKVSTCVLLHLYDNDNTHTHA